VPFHPFSIDPRNVAADGFFSFALFRSFLIAAAGYTASTFNQRRPAVLPATLPRYRASSHASQADRSAALLTGPRHSPTDHA
jgi:hypothetical protein